MRDQLDELAALQGKNQKLVDALVRKASDERARLEQARAVLVGMRTIHNRNADELAKLLDPNAAREAGIQARMGVLARSSRAASANRSTTSSAPARSACARPSRSSPTPTR
jgi:hypothetical protein